MESLRKWDKDYTVVAVTQSHLLKIVFEMKWNDLGTHAYVFVLPQGHFGEETGEHFLISRGRAWDKTSIHCGYNFGFTIYGCFFLSYLLSMVRKPSFQGYCES